MTENTNRFLTKFIWFIAALLTLRVIVWFFEQRAHDKEYWLGLRPCHSLPAGDFHRRLRPSFHQEMGVQETRKDA